MGEDKRLQLLARMESIVGRAFFNKTTQNWGPNGVFLGEGRAIRYPISFEASDGSTVKKSSETIDTSDNSIKFKTGRYTLGVNELNIVLALDRVLSMLEQEYGFDCTKKLCPYCKQSVGDLNLHVSHKHPDQWSSYSKKSEVQASLGDRVRCSSCGSFVKSLSDHATKCPSTIK